MTTYDYADRPDNLNAANNRTYGYQDAHYFLTQGNGPWDRAPGPPTGSATG